MLLIYIDDSTIHNMDNAVTYKFRSKSDYMPDHVEATGANAHHEDHSYGTWVAEGPNATVFWNWLKSQSMVPMPRPQSLSPEIDAATVEPRQFLTDDRVRVKDGNPKAGACGTIVFVYSAGTTCRIEFDDDETKVYHINQLEFEPAD